jgi:S1-C subfamily serine protease
MGMLAWLASSSSVHALTTQEIVDKSLPSIVAIIETNSATGDRWEGTGWFVSTDRIVTNSHVMDDQKYDHIEFINVATGEKYMPKGLSYDNSATDIAIITIDESTPNHLLLSSLEPKEGMGVVMIGNPKEEYGKVTLGTLGLTVNVGFGKRYNGTIINGEIHGGASLVSHK